MSEIIGLSSNTVYALVGAAILGWMGFLFLLMMIKSKVPEVIPLLKSAMSGTPVVFMWDALNRISFHAPKPEGDKHDGNMYDMHKFFGVKILPNPRAVCHTLLGRRIVNFYTKGATALTPKQAKALTDVSNRLYEAGMPANKSVIDALLAATDEDFEDLYGEEPEFMIKIKELRAELKETFITDGQFVFQTAKEFYDAAVADTAQGLEEFKSIESRKADMNANNGITETLKPLMVGVVVIVGLIIAAYIAYTLFGSVK